MNDKALELTLIELWKAGQDRLPIEQAVAAALHNILEHDLPSSKGINWEKVIKGRDLPFPKIYEPLQPRYKKDIEREK